jgi:polar amino acid transport system ATP-binding protein
MIFQDFQLFPHLTADRERHGGAGACSRKEPRRGREPRASVSSSASGCRVVATPIPALLRAVRSSASRSHALSRCSRAVSCATRITSALDPELKAEVLAVVEDLRRDGITLLVVTHEIGFARRAADRVLVLDHGTILEEGPPAEVLERPRAERTKQFPQPAARLERSCQGARAGSRTILRTRSPRLSAKGEPGTE